MFKLVIQDDEGKTTVVPLIRDEITIGRKEGNTIRLTERNVSRRHARILRNNGEVHIEDLGSYNGIRVNNARIAERVSLRVSDQVQIGDYKLYLKAEGLDQVDESRTTPIERVEAGPTDAMAAVAPGSPTAPLATPVPTAPPMIGNPNRTMVAIADTDPGRSVGPATAAAVAAMSAPGGYGKLVVLSSNFAGQEFELSRPQMIIGRVDNDIVINHRSISRNHAKLTRDPDTGRYTISDLQSSNGVRVNGSDYGKVELRRGDVIDLGHVRLRFVEAGEDFLFARDAVITDVPEVGGRRGMLVAVLAAIVVLGAGVVFYLTRSPDKHGGEGQVAPSVGPSGDLTPDGGEAVAEQPGDATAMVAVATNPGNPAAPSEDAAAAAADHPPVKPDTGTERGQKTTHCQELEAQKDWQGLRDCASQLSTLGARDRAEEFRVKAVKETGNALADEKIRKAIHDGNLKEAQRLLKAMGQDSVYWAKLNEAYKAAEGPAAEDNPRRAPAVAALHDCAALKRFQLQLAGGPLGTPNVLVAANVKCTDKAAAAPPPVDPGTKPPVGSGGDTAQSSGTPPPVKSSPCDTMPVDDIVSQAQNQFTAGFAKSALQLLTKALSCKQDVKMYRMAALYACVAHDATNAKLYYAKIPGQFQGAIVQRCQQEGITLQAP
jgi:pSer/pThr/pTyr-binding forkhead associated (FHA) protein